MVEVPRKKSPRAPTIALDEALERTLKAYDRERLHPTPTDVFAQNIGYKNANSGSALTALANLRYFALVDRPSDGMLAITKAVEAFKFAPSEEQRRSILVGFLKAPPLYTELLEKFASGLPSDANLKYELIQRGFIPNAAEAVLVAFRRSVAFVDYFARSDSPESADSEPEFEEEAQPSSAPAPSINRPLAPHAAAPVVAATPISAEEEGHDRIPVRLPGARRAWLVIPSPFFTADKARLKAQIDLLLTQDEEDELA